MEWTFEAAIVMGTLAGKHMSPQSRDRRVLMTSLLIRQLQEEIHPDQDSFHIVGENALDSTSSLIFTSARQKFPDMINVQAINARALVQSVAYPAMFPAIGQLFHWEQDDAPHINLYPVGVSIVPAGMATLQEISECIRTVPGHESDIMIGWVDNNGELVLAPPPFEEHYFEVGECVCAISRHSGENNNGTMPWPEETIEMLKGRKRKSVMQGKVHWP